MFLSLVCSLFHSRWRWLIHADAGVSLLILGQILRSTAMIHAASNFSHSVALYKMEHHVLVTGGIYR
jgi:protein-S-isoprenylcysteine O-methyltransferase